MTTTTTTTTTTTKPRRVTRATMAEAVAERVPFTYNRSASAEWTDALAARIGIGAMGCRLEPAARAEVSAMLAELDPATPVYVVRSYHTTAAIYAAGRWWTWDTRYSATTTTHQRLIRAGIAAAED